MGRTVCGSKQGHKFWVNVMHAGDTITPCVVSQTGSLSTADVWLLQRQNQWCVVSPTVQMRDDTVKVVDGVCDWTLCISCAKRLQMSDKTTVNRWYPKMKKNLSQEQVLTSKTENSEPRARWLGRRYLPSSDERCPNKFWNVDSWLCNFSSKRKQVKKQIS